MQCPYCGSNSTVKVGIRKLKRETVQRFQCKLCLKYFPERKIKKIEYPIKIILNTISIYNLGYTLEQTRKQMVKRFHIRIPESTIHSWVREYSKICTFSRLREQAIKLFKPEKMLLSQRLQHKQVYNFRLHKAKLLLQAKEFSKQAS